MNKKIHLPLPIAIIILLFVIGIGILFRILLRSEYTNPYNVEIKAELSKITTAAQEYYNANGSYIGLTTDLVLPKCSDKAYTIQISPDGKHYLGYARLCWPNTRILQGKRDAFWCVDSEGFFGEVKGDGIPSDIYTCPK